MFGLSFPEILVILVVALLVLGPTGMPRLARTIGKGMRDLRRATSELRGAFEEEFYKLDQEVEKVARADAPVRGAHAPPPVEPTSGVEPAAPAARAPEGVVPVADAAVRPAGTGEASGESIEPGTGDVAAAEARGAPAIDPGAADPSSAPAEGAAANAAAEGGAAAAGAVDEEGAGSSAARPGR